jgi:hypothetical protein
MARLAQAAPASNEALRDTVGSDFPAGVNVAFDTTKISAAAP